MDVSVRRELDEPLPHSCKYCENIEIDGTGPDVQQSFKYTLPEVQALAEKCMLFEWVLQLPSRRLEPPASLSLSISTNSEDLVFLDVDWSDAHGSLGSEINDEQSSLYIFAERDDPAARYIKSRPLTRSRAGPRNMGGCRKYFQRCLNMHEMCKREMERNQSYPAPTRLLHVGVDLGSDIRLHKVEPGDNPRYVALSYCWGRSNAQKEAKTTRANLQDRFGRIQLSQLPRTIKDAVKVARPLEFAYLWVDALCIVQDDPQDVADELAKMSGVYRGAILTVSAASAEDSMEGFLEDRDLARAYGALFRLPYRHGQGKNLVRGSILLSEQPIGGKHQEPIDRRAWTMQEHILSLRLLRFGSKQTIWKCRTCHCNIGGGASPHPVNEDVEFSVDEPYRITELQSRMQKFGGLGNTSVLGRWEETICEYTCRTLSVKSDKLPACAALAENFAEIMGWSTSDYLAGLWKNDIEAQLLWYRPEDSKSLVFQRLPGPTWSWASFDGPITFFMRDLLESEPGHVKAEAELKTHRIIHKSESLPYGEVLSGHLWLSGRLQQAHWDGLSMRRSSTSSPIGPLRVYWDLSNSVGPRSVWCLEIIGSYICVGLILGSNNQADFERLGFFEVDPRHSQLVKLWFREVGRQTVVLH